VAPGSPCRSAQTSSSPEESRQRNEFVAEERLRRRFGIDPVRADRDKARIKALGQNVDARTLTPGVAAATDRATPSGRTTGNYVEYAYKVTESDGVRTVSGIRWDEAEAPVGAYLLAYWTDGIGADWAPMRDLWGRYA
jgi:hypothetical protein